MVRNGRLAKELGMFGGKVLPRRKSWFLFFGGLKGCARLRTKHSSLVRVNCSDS